MTQRAAVWHAGKRLQDHELQERLEACPICNDRCPRTHVCQIDPVVSFLSCSACLGISANRMPTPETLDDYYANYYDRQTKELITFTSPQRIGRLMLRHLGQGSGKFKLRILDFGGGDGRIAIEAAKLAKAQFGPTKKIDITVVDYVKENAVVLPEGITLRFVEDLNDLPQDAIARFDLVIASAILEHIPKFEIAWKRLIGLTADSGLIYVRTPYMTPFKKFLSNLDLTYPAHVHDLGAAFWNHLPNRFNGLNILTSEPSFIETSLASHCLRTLIAAVLKAPAHLLNRLGLPSIWPYYGGWHVLYRKT